MYACSGISFSVATRQLRVEFSSHIDGKKFFLTPEESIQVQLDLNSDIVMVFDECPKYSAEKDKIKKSMNLSLRWAESAWGRYWGWDPKETWAFITWIIYAAYLHSRVTVGWKGSKSAWLSIAGYAAIVFNFFVINIWVTGLHSYAGV